MCRRICEQSRPLQGVSRFSLCKLLLVVKKALKKRLGGRLSKALNYT
jgi:hypothetical protein